MLLRRLHAQDFRNLALVRLEFDGPRQFFVGANAQGKTNLLEAAGLLGALRSFRGADAREMIRHGAAEARVFCEAEHERDGRVQVEITVRPKRREVLINGAKCRRLTDFLGRFPMVALSSHDLQLLRGAPQLRRRAFDLALSSLDEPYFNALRRYHEALEERTALLRGPRSAAPGEFAAFEAVMADAAVAVVAARTAACVELAAHFVTAYNRLTNGVEESPGFVYASESHPDSPDAWCELWEKSRNRDLTAKMTVHGPHRDDFDFQLGPHAAKAFGSEGQQRGLVVAWRLGQAAWQRARTGLAPVILADDVLGELDPARREGFWRAATDAGQVLATGTALPANSENWTVWNVHAGEFARA